MIGKCLSIVACRTSGFWFTHGRDGITGTDLDLTNRATQFIVDLTELFGFKSYDRLRVRLLYSHSAQKNGWKAFLGHLSKQLVEIGQEVKAGNLIAKRSVTQCRIPVRILAHYELRYRDCFDAQKVL